MLGRKAVWEGKRVLELERAELLIYDLPYYLI